MIKLSRDEIVQRLGPGGYLKAVLGGKVKKEMTREELDAILAKIQNVLTPEENTRGSYNNGQVYIACIELPFGDPRVKFITTFNNGQLGQNIKDLQADVLERDGLIGAHSLENLIGDVFTGCALPGVPSIKTKKKTDTDRPKPVPPQHTPKPTYEFIIDPTLVSYLIEHKGYLIAGAFSHTTAQKGKKLETFDELKEVGVPEGVLESASQSGFSVSLQSNVDFMRTFRAKILRLHRQRVNTLLADGRVTACIHEYMGSIKLGNNYTDALESLAQSSNARPAYEFFSNSNHKIDGVSVEEMFDALRFSALQIARKNRDPGLEERVRNSLGWWISVAKAAEVVDKDTRISQVVPFFEKARGRTSQAITNHVYEGMMTLTTNMLNQNLRYSSNEIDFIFDGLWLKGLLPKRGEADQTANSNEDNEFRESDRELTGLARQYTVPIKHLMRRFTAYDTILWPAFENLLKEGKVPKDLKLESPTEDYNFGIHLYNAVSANKRKEVFRTLKGDEPLAVPDGRRGTMVETLLTYYVGAQRSRLKEAVKSHYEQHPRNK